MLTLELLLTSPIFRKLSMTLEEARDGFLKMLAQKRAKGYFTYQPGQGRLPSATNKEDKSWMPTNYHHLVAPRPFWNQLKLQILRPLALDLPHQDMQRPKDGHLGAAARDHGAESQLGDPDAASAATGSIAFHLLYPFHDPIAESVS